MQIVIKNLNWPIKESGKAGTDSAPAPELQDDCSGIANLSAVSPRAPIVVGLVIVAAAFVLGTGAGALITLALFKF